MCIFYCILCCCSTMKRESLPAEGNQIEITNFFYRLIFKISLIKYFQNKIISIILSKVRTTHIKNSICNEILYKIFNLIFVRVNNFSFFVGATNIFSNFTRFLRSFLGSLKIRETKTQQKSRNNREKMEKKSKHEL